MRYKLENGIVVDTAIAVASWDEAQMWRGGNVVSVPTGSQWSHQRLYRSRKGRYYLECWCQRQGATPPYAKQLGKRDAAAWLLANDHQVPADLAAEASAVSE